MKNLILVLLLITTISACEQETIVIEAPDAVSFEADVQPIFNNSCVSCHGEVNPAGGLTLTEGLSYASLQENNCITPGDTSNYANSKLFIKMSSSHGGFSDESKMIIIRTWVQQGALTTDSE